MTKDDDVLSGADIDIRRFRPSDERAVLDLILSIQRDEFAIAITAEDQPDLRAIPDYYQTGAGDFWVAGHGAHVVGTIGLKDIGSSQAALRKMFVAAPYRGSHLDVATRLLSRLLAEADHRAITDVFLGTTEKFLAAHRFYEKHGFREIPAADLPNGFPRMAVDSKFYRYSLRSREG